MVVVVELVFGKVGDHGLEVGLVVSGLTAVRAGLGVDSAQPGLDGVEGKLPGRRLVGQGADADRLVGHAVVLVAKLHPNPIVVQLVGEGRKGRFDMGGNLRVVARHRQQNAVRRQGEEVLIG